MLENDKEAGEPALAELLSGFSCPKNSDVEHFLNYCPALQKFSEGGGTEITGAELLKLAWDKIRQNW